MSFRMKPHPLLSDIFFQGADLEPAAGTPEPKASLRKVKDLDHVKHLRFTTIPDGQLCQTHVASLSSRSREHRRGEVPGWR